MISKHFGTQHDFCTRYSTVAGVNVTIADPPQHSGGGSASVHISEVEVDMGADSFAWLVVAPYSPLFFTIGHCCIHYSYNHPFNSVPSFPLYLPPSLIICPRKALW